MQILKYGLSTISHLFFPHVCSGCGSDILDKDQLICVTCIEKIPVTNFQLYNDNPVEKIFWGRIPVQQATSYTYFTKDSLFQSLMHQFKYRGKLEIGTYFGRKLGETILHSERFPILDGLVPLPLHAAKEKKRGYNQAKILCDGISEILNVPVLERSVTRKRETETQTHKSRIERWKNMEGNFMIPSPSSLENKNILLVDDVITTGATLESCGLELLKCQGVALFIASLAYTSV